MENGVRGRARADGGGKLALRRNKKVRDFTQPFFHKSTLLSTAKQPVELSEKSLQNLWNKWPPHPVCLRRHFVLSMVFVLRREKGGCILTGNPQIIPNGTNRFMTHDGQVAVHYTSRFPLSMKSMRQLPRKSEFDAWRRIVAQIVGVTYG